MKGRDEGTHEALPDPCGSGLRHRCATALLLVFICAVCLAHARAYNFLSDDAFITLRYSRNLTEGHGLVFNLNERVEGFTSPLWALMLAGTHLLGLDLLTCARSLGIGIGLVTLLLSYKLARVTAGQTASPLITGMVPPLLLAANGSFACWSASGMETMLYVCLVTASFVTVLSGKLRVSVLPVAALMVTRPEGAAVFVVLGLFQLLRYRRYRRTHLIMWFIACCIPAVAWLVFRRLYYGDWLPNTYYAKTGGGWDQVGRGLTYLAEYLADHEGLVVMGPLIAYGLLAGSLERRFLTLGAICLWGASVMVGGDGLPMYRFALAPLPLLAVLEAHALADIHRRAEVSSVHVRTLHAATIAVVLLLIAVHVTRPITSMHFRRYKYHKEVEIPRWTQVGKWLRENAREGESVAASPIGAVSFYSGLRTFDMLGLTDKHIAHLQMPKMEKGWAGHDKHDGQYILRRRPTYLLAGNIDVTEEPRDGRQMHFIPYINQSIWKREEDLYETDILFTMYQPACARLESGQFLNCYRLREGYETRPTAE